MNKSIEKDKIAVLPKWGQKIGKLIATLFFVGYIPVAPGTIASLLALPFYILVKDNLVAHFLIIAVSLILGFWSTSLVCKARFFHGTSDPSQVVIDEFSSTFIVFLFVPFSIKFLVIGFLLFRTADIFKIPPIKKLEKLPAGYGIMLDDIAAAILANIVLQVLRFLLYC